MFYKRNLLFENMGKYYFIFLVASYFSTYPVRVFLKNPDISLIKYVVIIFIMIGLSMQMMFTQNLIKRKFKKVNIIIIILLSFINILYYINSSIVYSDGIILHHTFIKYINYSIILIYFLLFYPKLSFEINKNFYGVKFLIYILSFMTFVGVILNSVLWQIPYGYEINEKYIVGIFLRAGAGYLDPNFLAMNIVILFFLNLLLVNDKSVLKKFSLFLLIVSVFLTFSRGAWIFFTLIIFLYFYREKSVSTKRLMIYIIVLLFISFIIFLFFKNYTFLDFGIIMRRFYDEEGRSSVYDRFSQYKFALDYFYENLSFLSLIIGFGGLDLFENLYGAHLHNFFLGLILDVGLLGTFLIFFLIIYFYKNSNNLIAKYLLMYWILQANVLPNLPDNLFIIFLISLIMIKKKEKI